MAVDKIVTVYEQDMTRLKADTDAAIANNLKLESSAKKAGSAGADAFGKSAQSVDTLNDELKRLEGLLQKAANPKSVALLNSEIEKTKGKINAASQAQQNFTKEVDNSHSKVRSFQDGISKVGAAIGIAFGVQQVIAFGSSSVMAYAEAEKAAQKLLFALNGNIVAQENLINQAKELQKATVFEDDAIVAQQAYLAAQGRTEEQIKKTIAAATQLSTVTGEDLATSVMKLDATYEGNIGRLGKLDSRFKKLTQAQLENGAAIDLINEKYKGFAEDASKSTSGRLEQLSNAWGDIKESIGGALTEFALYATQGPFAYNVNKKAAENHDKALRNLINTRYDEVKALAAQGDVMAKQELARRDLLFASKSEEKTLGDLKEKLDKANAARENAVPGTKEYIKLTKEINSLTIQIAHATGQQTEAEKKLTEERKAAAEKEKARLAELRKQQAAFNEEIIRNSLDAQGRELFDLDAKARKMVESGLEQVKIDEYIRGEEVKINKKYDDLEEEQHQKNQQDMLDDLNAMVDADEEANKKEVDNAKKATEEKIALRQKLFDSALELEQAFFDISNAFREREAEEINARKEAELEALDEQFGVRQKTETAYEKKKRQIQEKFAAEEAALKRKQAIADKGQAIFKIALETAIGVTKYTAGLPLTAPLLALMIAAGAAQIAAVAARPIPAFAEGVVGFDGKGTGTSDSNIVRISKGESIITADSTSKKQRELEALNISAAEFDRLIYKDYVTPALKKKEHEFAERMAASFKLQGGFNDRNLIRAISGNKQVELGPQSIQGIAKGVRKGIPNKARGPQ